MFELVSRDLFQLKSTSEQNAYQKMSDTELNQALELIGQEARALGEKNLKLDMARGKPSPAQTALSKPMLDELNSASDLTDNGSFADNYGNPWGLPSARAFAAELTGVPADQVIVVLTLCTTLFLMPLLTVLLVSLLGLSRWQMQRSRAPR